MKINKFSGFSKKNSKINFSRFPGFPFNFQIVKNVGNVLKPFYYYFTLLRVFPTRVSRWILTGVWVRASLLKSPGLFSVFWPSLIILSFGWYPLVLLFPNPPVPIPILWWLYRAHQLQLVSPWLTFHSFFSLL